VNDRERPQGEPRPPDGTDDEPNAGGGRDFFAGRQMEIGEDILQEPIAKKAYYAIGEVCDLTGLKPHVLRYWETQFKILSPTKNRAGNRVYRPRDIELILLVKHLLYEEKYTIEGAKQRLQEMRESGELDEESQMVLDPEFLATMKDELRRLQRILTLPDPTPESPDVP
jgi:DNA-binding transcriptional MerR regulator